MRARLYDDGRPNPQLALARLAAEKRDRNLDLLRCESAEAIRERADLIQAAAGVGDAARGLGQISEEHSAGIRKRRLCATH